ncbi:hypothetical protein AOCH_005566 [Aspergillus ochraceoroseus]|uniref:alpha-1,2-Mannosidase n=1 Tax=Aspergillus ochraceoroseus TaxID=138278 RepID=A0A0F8XPG1_9EURO|nr:hypothetical protein AOCH_005566 [Aspergillus ochraceoroseus]
MFRARRYRISLVIAVVFVLVILHFTGSHDPPTILQVPPPPPPAADHYSSPQFPKQANDQLKNGYNSNNNNYDNGGARNPGIPAAPELLEQQQHQEQQRPQAQPQRPSQQRPSQQQQSPSQDSSSVSDKGPASSAGHTGIDIDRPPKNSNEGPRPQSGAQTQAHHNEEEAEDDVPSPVHWKPMPEQYPINPEAQIPLPPRQPKLLPRLQAKFKDESSADKMQRLQRLDAVKATFQHAWNGYKVSAMGHDEVKPLRGGFKDTFNGWGATLVDTLDTLWIMGLKEEFSIAIDHVKRIDFTTSKRKDIPVFETVIRYLGGLLGAYDISGHKYNVLLEKAVELADILMGAFDTPNRMPTLFYKWTPDYAYQSRRGDYKAVLAELGSLSLEFTRLAQLTKDNKYYDAIARITNALEQFQDATKFPGLWPLQLDASGCRKPAPSGRDISKGQPVKASTLPYGIELNSTASISHARRQLHEGAQAATYDDDSTGSFYATESDTTSERYRDRPPPPTNPACTEGLNNQVSGTDKFGFGALGDSTYEYLPKEYMLLGGNNEQYRTMYAKAMDAAREHLVFQPMLKNNRDVRFLATVTMTKKVDESHLARTIFAYEGTHLTCFAGGMFAIGSKLFGIEGDLELGRQLTDGCVWAYETTKTGIMPEAFKLVPCQKDKPCEWSETAYYRALDPYADERPKSHRKRASKNSSWHVIATGESGKQEDDESDTSEEIEKKDLEPAAEEVNTPSHEEYVTARIRSERLPPGVIGISSRQYILRPEAIESVFIMFRLTGDPSWREKGWKMYQAVAEYTKTELANSAIDDVTVESPRPLDSMESFWLAETLKYFYLLFSDTDVVSLDEYVLNTEAHPFKRPVY